jgi:hypothetical protein
MILLTPVLNISHQGQFNSKLYHYLDLRMLVILDE